MFLSWGCSARDAVARIFFQLVASKVRGMYSRALCTTRKLSILTFRSDRNDIGNFFGWVSSLSIFEYLPFKQANVVHVPATPDNFSGVVMMWKLGLAILAACRTGP